MTNPNNNDDILKLYELSQQNNKWMIAGMCFQGLVSLITALSLVWTSIRRKKPNLAMRLLAKKEAMARLKLELDFLEKQAKYEADLTRFEAGLKSDGESTDLSRDLEKKGDDLVDKVTNKVNKELTDQTDKLVKSVGDKLQVNKLTSFLGEPKKDK